MPLCQTSCGKPNRAIPRNLSRFFLAIFRMKKLPKRQVRSDTAEICIRTGLAKTGNVWMLHHRKPLSFGSSKKAGIGMNRV